MAVSCTRTERFRFRFGWKAASGIMSCSSHQIRSENMTSYSEVRLAALNLGGDARAEPSKFQSAGYLYFGWKHSFPMLCD